MSGWKWDDIQLTSDCRVGEDRYFIGSDLYQREVVEPLLQFRPHTCTEDKPCDARDDIPVLFSYGHEFPLHIGNGNEADLEAIEAKFADNRLTPGLALVIPQAAEITRLEPTPIYDQLRSEWDDSLHLPIDYVYVPGRRRAARSDFELEWWERPNKGFLT